MIIEMLISLGIMGIVMIIVGIMTRERGTKDATNDWIHKGNNDDTGRIFSNRTNNISVRNDNIPVHRQDIPDDNKARLEYIVWTWHE